MTALTKATINPFQELNVLVAQTLGWKETEFEQECSQFTPGAQWQYGGDYYAVKIQFLAPDNNAIGEDFDAECWFDTYGYVPDFSNDWSDTQLLLEECDHRNLVINWVRDSECMGCSFSYEKNPVRTTTFVKRVFSHSMALVTVLAWLKFRGHDIELNLDKLEKEND